MEKNEVNVVFIGDISAGKSVLLEKMFTEKFESSSIYNLG